MRILLDTHVLLFHLMDSPQLGPVARAALLSPDNELMLSMASLWEIAIKISIGKLVLVPDWARLITNELAINQVHRLPINDAHCVQVAALPFHHRDPFDRMLVAQAMVERMTLMSGDTNMRGYPIEVLW